MIFQFSTFELDTEKNELRQNGREVFLQPKIFDLLLYLVSNHSRTVTKEELLDEVWPGVIVTEGSLQRAVCIARGILRHGGSDCSIKTISRQGYRFCEEVVIAATKEKRDRLDPDLEMARDIYNSSDWEGAAREFKRLDQGQAGLGAVDLERWAYAIQCQGRLPDAVEVLERAVVAHLAIGDKKGAVRVVLDLVHVQFELGEFAVAKGWFHRARSLCPAEIESRESGLIEIFACKFAIGEKDFDKAVAYSKKAIEIGRSLGDIDVEALGLAYLGNALLSRGDIDSGSQKLDEAAATVLTGQVSPLVGGIIYCGVVWGYRNLADWQKAGQWVNNFTRWCDHSGISTFFGSCSLHTAEVLGLRGEIDVAQRAIESACNLLPENCARVMGEAFRILGDLHLVKGEYERADEAFRRAHELGYDPQPGYAWLQLAYGNSIGAIKSLQRALNEGNWSTLQRRTLLLANLVIIAANEGHLSLAKETMGELESTGDFSKIPALNALYLRAKAEIAFQESRIGEGVLSLRQAIAIWQELSSPLNVADLRLRLAEFYIEDADFYGAELEVATAESIYNKTGKFVVPLERSAKLRTVIENSSAD